MSDFPRKGSCAVCVKRRGLGSASGATTRHDGHRAASHTVYQHGRTPRWSMSPGRQVWKRKRGAEAGHRLVAAHRVSRRQGTRIRQGLPSRRQGMHTCAWAMRKQLLAAVHLAASTGCHGRGATASVNASFVFFWLIRAGCCSYLARLQKPAPAPSCNSMTHHMAVKSLAPWPAKVWALMVGGVRCVRFHGQAARRDRRLHRQALNISNTCF